MEMVNLFSSNVGLFPKFEVIIQTVIFMSCRICDRRGCRCDQRQK
jgi:hypothetical protein